MNMKAGLTALLCTLLIGSGCKKEDEYARGNTVVVQMASEPDGLHPLTGASGSRRDVQHYLLQRLIANDLQTLEMVPMLARALPEVRDNGTTYVYEIDPEARFDDGSPVLAADVLFSIKAIQCPLLKGVAGQALFSLIRDAEADPANNRKVALYMREQNMLNPYLPLDIPIVRKSFFDPQGLLDEVSVAQMSTGGPDVENNPKVQAWAAEFNDAKYATDPQFLKGTTGPYYVSSWIPKQELVLSRRDNYWGKDREHPLHAQYPDKIVFREVADEAALEMQLRQGEIDVATNISTLVFEKLSVDSALSQKYRFLNVQLPSYSYIGLNCRPDGVKHKAIFDDKRVRRAFSFAMPVDAIVQDIYKGRVERVASPVLPGRPEYNRKLQPVPSNLDSARALLDAAGWKDSDGDLVRDKVVRGVKTSLKVTLSYPAGRQVLQDIIDRMIPPLEQAGFSIVPEPLDMRAGLQPRMIAHDFDAYLAGSSTTVSQPYDFEQLWHSNSWSKGQNFFGFNSPAADRLIMEYRLSTDPVRAKVVGDSIQALIYEAQPVVFFFLASGNSAILNRFEQPEPFKSPPHIPFGSLRLKR